MSDDKQTKKEWEPIEVSDSGHVAEVLQGGGTKISLQQTEEPVDLSD
jgi:hypothetical protein